MAALGGAASIGSYVIVHWTITKAPLASVAVRRETNMLFAALGSTWLLNEQFGLQRALSTRVVVPGVIGLRLACTHAESLRSPQQL